jgi:Ca2+-binding EF-hand superfamily protein
VAPTYYAPPVVTYAAPARTGFDYADANGDGYVSFDEAAVYPHWQRNFGNMDRNRDGYLTRDEVNGWRYR